MRCPFCGRRRGCLWVGGRLVSWGDKGCLKQYYRVDRRQIHYVKFILEGYDGLAVMRTVDPEAGVVVLHVPPGCEKDVNAVVEDLKKHIRIEPLPSVDHHRL